jgi:hypothetical protein
MYGLGPKCPPFLERLESQNCSERKTPRKICSILLANGVERCTLHMHIGDVNIEKLYFTE